MKTLHLYTFICLICSLLLATSACQQEKDTPLTELQGTGSITLHFNLTPTSCSRGGDVSTTQLYYEVKDGKITPCEAPEPAPTSRAGDGNTADGGGMADLTVFLVDATNDHIVARQSFTSLQNATTQTMNFLHLEPGEYIAYAYANTIGNDWFTLPTESETSFANYKDALLKNVTSGAPVVANNRMPLTGKQEMTVSEGTSTRTIDMLRTVGKISVKAINQRTEGVTAQTPTLNAFIPQTGWVFKHADILKESNPLHAPTIDDEGHTIIPGTNHLLFESLLYETSVNTGFTFSMTYKEAEYEFQSNFSDRLQKIRDESILIKLYGSEKYLRLNKVENDYQLQWVEAIDLDEQCFWIVGGSGKQQRPLINKYYNVYMNLKNNTVSFSSSSQSYHFGNSADYTTIGTGPALTYSNGTFSASDKGTLLQFYTYVEGSGNNSFTSIPIKVEDIVNENTHTNLITIHRNQHIEVNLLFK